MTSVRKDLSGSFEESEQTCVDEFNKSPEYHDLMITDYKLTIVKPKEAELHRQNHELDEAKEEKRRQQEKIDDLKALLLAAEQTLLQKEQTVVNKEKLVAEVFSGLGAVEKIMQKMITTKESLPSQEVPEECQGRADCCCSIDRQPYKVKVDKFTSWSRCHGAQTYTSKLTSIGCPQMMPCSSCRKKICENDTFCP